MGLKLEFVERAMKPGARMSALCREFNISRETGYKWRERFKRLGPDGLEEQSRRPRGSPLATAEDVIEAIVDVREKYPRRGPKKLFVILQRKFGSETPSVATIARVLKRFGLVRRKSRFGRVRSIVERAPSVRAAACNELWTVDFKGWWRALDGERCEPLTVRDAFSKFVLDIRIMRTPALEAVRAAFVAIFRKYGLPDAIQCDNGVPFINVQARGGLTQLSAWWISLGIRVVRSRPGCPQDNGGHERMHRDMRADLQAFPAATQGAEQRACDRWRQEFNHVRPHEALGGKTPAELYKRSQRRPRKTNYLYPSNWIVRTVTDRGGASVAGVVIQVGLGLRRARVAFEPRSGTTHRLWFRDVDLGDVELPLSTDFIDDVITERLGRGPRRSKKVA